MSQLLGGTDPRQIIFEDDDREKAECYTYQHPNITLRDTSKDISFAASYDSDFWPGPGMHGILGDGGDVNYQAGIWHSMPEITRGQSASYFISGYARNAGGQPISGVTLKLYLTSSDQVVSTTTSASDGSYSLNTGYGGQSHYIVAYLSGGGSTPDIEGTTVNTLVPGVPGA